jgi:hypothetical protein
MTALLIALIGALLATLALWVELRNARRERARAENRAVETADREAAALDRLVLRVLVGEAQRQMRKSIDDAREQERRADECDAYLTEAQADRERIDDLISGVYEIECMGTSVRYFNAWAPGSDMFATTNDRGLRDIMDDARRAARLASSSEPPTTETPE